MNLNKINFNNIEFEYFSKIDNLLKIVEKEEKNNLQKCVYHLVNAIINEKSIYIFGASHAGILSQEAFYRAGGLININPIFAPEISVDRSPITMTSKMERLEGYGNIIAETINFQKNDILIVHSVSGRNPVTIEIAKNAAEKGVIVIGITSLNYSKSVSSRHSCGRKMYDFCDVIIDNHGDIGDACIILPNIPQKVSPTSTVIGTAILNAIISETARILAELRDMENVPIFSSANMDGGDEFNKMLLNKFQNVIHYKY